jgi:hypothetical protein
MAWLSGAVEAADAMVKTANVVLVGKETRAGKESGWARESARAFLTVSNPNLKFWCGVADFDMNAILRKYWPDAGPS